MSKQETKKLQEQARILFFSGYKVSEIATILDLPVDFVRVLAFGPDGSGKYEKCWHRLKEELGPASVAAFVHAKKDVLNRTAGLAVNALNKSLENLNNKIIAGEIELSVQDMTGLAGIVQSMDKIVKLEEGKATDIINTIGLTVEEAKRIIKDDPFAKAVTVDYRRIEDVIHGKESGGSSSSGDESGEDLQDSD